MHERKGVRMEPPNMIDFGRDTVLPFGRSMVSNTQCGAYEGISGQGDIRINRFLAKHASALIVLALTVFSSIARPDETHTANPGYWVPREPSRAHYKIDCTIKLAEDFLLQGKEVIFFVNTTSKPMQTFAITWFKLGNQTLKITANGKPVTLPTPLKSFPQDFILAEPIGPGKSLTLEVEFGISAP